MSADNAPLKVSAEAHRVLKFLSASEGRTMGAIMDEAVVEFLAAHRDEIEAGFVHAREVLGIEAREKETT